MAIFQVQTVNGQKKLVPMTGGVPDGSVGSLIMKYKKIQPKNCLYCDGRDTTGTDEELRIYYPALYMYLGSNVLPDYRECVMVGAEQNTTDTIATHDVYTQGQFKDDQMQKIMGKATLGVAGVDSFGGFVGSGFSGAISGGDGKKQTFKAYDTQSANSYSSLNLDSSQVTRTGTPDVTHGKQKAVYVYIVAVDSVVVSDDESFLRVVENYIDEKNSYSETETLTGGTWIDGKPIYRKVVTFTAKIFNNGSWTEIPLSVSNIGQVVNVVGIYTAVGQCWNIFATQKGTNYIQLNQWRGNSLTLDCAIIEYTKSS